MTTAKGRYLMFFKRHRMCPILADFAQSVQNQNYASLTLDVRRKVNSTLCLGQRSVKSRYTCRVGIDFVLQFLYNAEIGKKICFFRSFWSQNIFFLSILNTYSCICHKQSSKTLEFRLSCKGWRSGCPKE